MKEDFTKTATTASLWKMIALEVIKNLHMKKGSGLIQRGTVINHWHQWFKHSLEKKGFRIEDKK